jgi:hypothetical protein
MITISSMTFRLHPPPDSIFWIAFPLKPIAKPPPDPSQNRERGIPSMGLWEKGREHGDLLAIHAAWDAVLRHLMWRNVATKYRHFT